MVGTDESTEHRTITQAADAVELAMHRQRKASSPAAIGRILVDAMASLHAHRGAAEGEQGILAQMDVTHGQCECLMAARSEHAALVHEAQELSRMLAMSAAPDRARLHSFATALRAHAALLADLRLNSLDRDIGVGD